ncbi:DUF7108 domain-containing protein [Halobellus rarus]|uniref:RnhA operon protein n=1 Tax=Halobellus rarus TaxID=1126237 RepID=A0ABD6CH83_9EURY|nr:hypothetical protein [Halobellus rarus]
MPEDETPVDDLGQRNDGSAAGTDDSPAAEADDGPAAERDEEPTTATDGASTAAIDSPPGEAVDEAERLTRLAREAAVEAAAEAYRERRDDLVDEHDFTARVREEDDTLVLYPEEWVEDGTVQFGRIENTDRAVEVSLSGPDHGAEWDAVEEANRAIVDDVEREYGPDHAANVRAFADFMSNHYLKRVDDATEAEREEFLTEYFQRNVWPSDAQESIVAESVDLVNEVGDDVPGP